MNEHNYMLYCQISLQLLSSTDGGVLVCRGQFNASTMPWLVVCLKGFVKFSEPVAQSFQCSASWCMLFLYGGCWWTGWWTGCRQRQEVGWLALVAPRERLCWEEDCRTGASWGGVCSCGQTCELPFIELMTWLTHGIGSSPSSSSSLWQRPVSSLVPLPLGSSKSPAGKSLPFSSHVIGWPGWYTFKPLGFISRRFRIAW